VHAGICGNSRGENCLAKGSGKKANYKNFCIEIKRMWNLKCKNIPPIIGATGIVKNILRKNLEATPGKHSIDSLQNTAILGISHIIRRVLPKRWGSPLVREKYQEEKACDERQ
jgi:hypothetical protein